MNILDVDFFFMRYIAKHWFTKSAVEMLRIVEMQIVITEVYSPGSLTKLYNLLISIILSTLLILNIMTNLISLTFIKVIIMRYDDLYQ